MRAVLRIASYYGLRLELVKFRTVSQRQRGKVALAALRSGQVLLDGKQGVEKREGEVPDALALKYPDLGSRWGWFWVFPAATLSPSIGMFRGQNPYHWHGYLKNGVFEEC